MATNTYVALDKVTVSTATPSVTFTGINQSYTDLVLVVNGYAITQDNSLLCRVGNSSVDTGNNYSTTFISGNGSSAASGRFSNVDFMRLQSNGGMGTSSSNIGTYIAHFMNYSNTTTNKTVLSRANQTGGLYPATEAVVNLWRSTAAINVITVFPFTGASFGVGSTFSLYGIKAQVTPGTAKATGGTITYDNFGNVYHTFTSSGTFQPLEALTCDYVVVAGGGGGGTRWAGGGGAGGLRSTFGATGGGGNLETPITLSPSNYSITVGGPGAGATGVYVAGTQGNNSTFSSITSTGGGGGGTSSAYATIGGSGGAGGMRLSGLAGLGAAGTTGQGYAGGNAASSGGYAGGGGGGAGAIGGTADNNNFSNAGDGGNGVTLYVGGSALSLAGGGGGGSEGGGTFWGAGGLGGGGNGNSSAGQGGNGTVNTGGGGGGGGNDSGTGGSGGSGIVIIRYSGV